MDGKGGRELDRAAKLNVKSRPDSRSPGTSLSQPASWSLQPASPPPAARKPYPPQAVLRRRAEPGPGHPPRGPFPRHDRGQTDQKIRERLARSEQQSTCWEKNAYHALRSWKEKDPDQSGSPGPKGLMGALEHLFAGRLLNLGPVSCSQTQDEAAQQGAGRARSQCELRAWQLGIFLTLSLAVA